MTTTAPVRTRRSGATHAPARRQAPARPRVAAVTPQQRRKVVKRRPLSIYLAGAIFIATLFGVVAGQSVVTQGQVQLARTQAQVQAAETLHRQAVLAVARLETPTKIASAATATLHLAQPSSVVDLPAVPLDQPLGPPRITPAPPGAPAAVVLAPITPPGPESRPQR